VGSRWAAHQCLSATDLCRVMNSHLIGVVPPTVATLFLMLAIWRTPALHPYLRRLGNAMGMALAAQILLGIVTLRLRLQVEPLTIAHHTLGATLLAILVSFTVLAWRDGRRSVPGDNRIQVQVESQPSVPNPVLN
jgi:cytochrome c oxidase assembly protein subunit 15